MVANTACRVSDGTSAVRRDAGWSPHRVIDVIDAACMTAAGGSGESSADVYSPTSGERPSANAYLAPKLSGAGPPRSTSTEAGSPVRVTAPWPAAIVT